MREKLNFNTQQNRYFLLFFACRDQTATCFSKNISELFPFFLFQKNQNSLKMIPKGQKNPYIMFIINFFKKDF